MSIRIVRLSILMMLMCAQASASSQNATYHNHGLYFDVPNGWNVIRDQEDENDTQVVVSDNVSAIRIDILKKNYVLNLSTEGDSWNSPEYNSYKNNIAKAKKNMCYEQGGGGNNGKPLSFMQPSAKSCGVGQSCGVETTGMVEWILLWYPAGFGDKLIGVHALLEDIYPKTRFDWHEGELRYMSDPLLDLLGSVAFGSSPKKPTPIKRVISPDGWKEVASNGEISPVKDV